jgi:hypothetical protein
LLQGVNNFPEQDLNSLESNNEEFKDRIKEL